MRRTVAVAALAAVLLVAGCSRNAPAGDEIPSRPERLETGIPAPGLTRSSSGEVTAVGTLVYRRDEGGFFAVADIRPGEKPAPNARIVAILTDDTGDRALTELATLVGAYCGFTGTLRSQTSTLAASPEVTYVRYRVYEPVPE